MAISLGGLLILGIYYANLSPPNAMLLAFSLIAAAGPLPAAVLAWPLWQQTILRAGCWFAPLAAAISLAAA